jgi:hypothetical protein
VIFSRVPLLLARLLELPEERLAPDEAPPELAL